MDAFLSQVAALVAERIGRPAAEVRALLQPARDPARGDLALPCFKLAAALGRTGKDAAPGLAHELAAGAWSGVVRSAEAAGPYVNFRLDPGAVAREVLTAVWTRTPYGGSDEGRGQTVVIDFSSPNIAKPFHLGHLRSTVIGWSLRQLHRALGYQVVGINHLGDWGTQFGLMIAAWNRWAGEYEEPIERGSMREIDAFVEAYVRINKLAAEDPAVQEEGRAWFKRLEDGDPVARSRWEYFVSRSKVEFARIYEVLGVTHESEAGESFYNDKMPPMLERLRAKGLLVEGKTPRETALEAAERAEHRAAQARETITRAEAELGGAPDDKQRKKVEKELARARGELPKLEKDLARARAEVPERDEGGRPLGVDLSADELGFLILVKTDEGTNYATRDITAAYYRAETYRPAKLIYVVGSDQRDHFVRWFKIVERMGEPWAAGLVHVGFGKYRELSTRKGTAVFLEEVLERARVKAREAAAQATKKVELSPEEQERVARAIGTGAVKFFDLRNERMKDFELVTDGTFDWDRLLDLKGDTGPYLQFAYARLAGILRRHEGAVGPDGVAFGLLAEPEATALLWALAAFPGKVREAAAAYEPSVVARALIDLAQKTHLFVHHHRVLDATPSPEQAAAGVTPEALRAARVLLVACARKVIGEALALLGIEALEQM